MVAVLGRLDDDFRVEGRSNTPGTRQLDNEIKLAID